MTPLSLDEMRDLAPAYVMGTLSADELAAFELTLLQPTAAQALAPEIEALRMAIEFIATERSIAPPAGLRERVLARIASEEQGNSGARGAKATPVRPLMFSPDAPLAEPPPVVPENTTHSEVKNPPERVSGEIVIPITSTRATRTPAAGVHLVPVRSRTPWWIAGALGAALAASAIFAVDLNKRLRSTQDDFAELQRVAASSTTKLAESEATLRSLLEGGSDLVLVRLIANESAEPGMQVFWNKKKGSAVVLATGLKPVANDRIYVLWMIKSGTPVAVRLFNVDADGRAVVSGVPVPTSTEGIEAFAVTEEPAGGSPQPTMTPFLVGAVPKS